MKVFFISLFTLLCFVTALYAQNPASHIIPPSPDAASLGKFADFPMNLYNGLPDITIPLYTAELKDIKVPVSLSYHSGGIPVSEVPSWVGSGWALNAGGVITRSVRGLPDEQTGGWLSAAYGALPECTPSGTSYYSYFTHVIEGGLDLEPDMFYFNFGGVSGKFILDQSGNAHTIPYRKIKIIKNPDVSSTGLIDWEIITEDGLVYLFKEQEASQTVSTTSSGATTSSSSANYTSSWFLSEIHLPYTTDTDQKISFEYDSYNLSYTMPDAENSYEWTGSLSPCRTINASTTQTDYLIPAAKRIKKITFPNGTIEFTAGAYRTDLKGGQVLDKVMIKSAGQTIKTFKLSYNYFSINSMVEFGDLPVATATTTTVPYLRLSLKSIRESDETETLFKPPYLFTYESGTWLPNRLTSKAQDHWGFFNGEIGSTTLIPQHIDSFGNYVDGPTRNAVESYTKAGVLESVTYPTGGSSTFTYELNDTESPLYPDSFTKISSTYSLGMCLNGKPPILTVNDQVSHQVDFKLSFTSSKWPTGATTTCSNGQFVAGQPSTYIYINVYDVSDPAHPVNMNVTGSAVNATTIGYATANYTVHFTLPNGTYQIQARRGSTTGPEVQSAENNLDGVYSYTISGAQYAPGSKKVGGLRIAQTDLFDPVSNKHILKKYEYKDDSNKSSGDVQYAPQYKYHYTQVQACTPDVTYSVEYDVYNSFSNTPLTTMQGGIIGYNKVTVYEGKDASGNFGINGKTEYLYNSAADFNYLPLSITSSTTTSQCYNVNGKTSFCNYPYAPPASMDWDRGQLLQQTVYKYGSGTYTKVKDIINTYKDDYLGDAGSYHSDYDVLGARVGQTRVGDNSTSNSELIKPILSVQYYLIPSRASKLIKTDEIDYFGTASNEHINEFAYDNIAHMQLSRNILHQSNGDLLTTQYLYPLDYTNTTGSISDMKNANIINKPIEVVKMKTTGTSTTITDGQITTYKADAQVGLPSSIYKIESVEAIPLSNFKFSNQSTAGSLPNTGSKTYYTADAHYPTTTESSFYFNNNGNLIRNRTRGVKNAAYQWGYNDQYVVATATNTVPDNIFFNGFEEGTGNSTVDDAKTGHYSHTGTYSKSLTGLDAGSYVLAYWKKSTDDGTWSFHKSTISGVGSNYTISISGQIDDVRFYPSDAQMTTYTYDPLVGMTSSTDSKGMVTYYEYDPFMRLMNIRDKRRNIIKHIDYHYQEQ